MHLLMELLIFFHLVKTNYLIYNIINDMYIQDYYLIIYHIYTCLLNILVIFYICILFGVILNEVNFC